MAEINQMKTIDQMATPCIVPLNSEMVMFANRNTQISKSLAKNNWPPSEWAMQHCRSCGSKLNLSICPIPFPEEYKPNSKSYIVSELLFHGPSCAARFIIDHLPALKSTSLSLLHMFCIDVFGYTYTQCAPAPPLNELKKYGGDLSENEYVDLGGNIHVVALTNRMVPAIVINEMRSKKQTFAEDAARMHWSVKNVSRPIGASDAPHKMPVANTPVFNRVKRKLATL
jgi:hypothetical protein